MGHRRVHRAPARPRRRPRRPGRPLHARDPRGRRRRVRRGRLAGADPRGRRPRGVAGHLALPRGAAAHHHRHRGRLLAARRRARPGRPARGPGRGRPAERPARAGGSAPARIVAGLLARRAADAGPLTLVPCDNLPENGPVLGGAWSATWPTRSTRVCSTGWRPPSRPRRRWSTGSPRSPPTPTAPPSWRARAWTTRCPVVTEPFSEWVISGAFPGGRPAWESAGAVLTDDVTPYEQRKLWLLNGGHSLLAYVGSLRGCVTVDDAVADEHCRALLEQWWSVCTPHLAVSRDRGRGVLRRPARALRQPADRLRPGADRRRRIAEAAGPAPAGAARRAGGRPAARGGGHRPGRVAAPPARRRRPGARRPRRRAAGARRSAAARRRPRRPRPPWARTSPTTPNSSPRCAGGARTCRHEDEGRPLHRFTLTLQVTRCTVLLVASTSRPPSGDPA